MGELIGTLALESLTTNASLLTVVYNAVGIRHVGGFDVGIAPKGAKLAPLQDADNCKSPSV